MVVGAEHLKDRHGIIQPMIGNLHFLQAVHTDEGVHLVAVQFATVAGPGLRHEDPKLKGFIWDYWRSLVGGIEKIKN